MKVRVRKKKKAPKKVSVSFIIAEDVYGEAAAGMDTLNLSYRQCQASVATCA